MKKLIFLCLIFLAIETHAKYEWYVCNNAEQAKRCASGCSKSTDADRRIYDFKVNANNNSVIMNYFDKDGKYLSSRALKNCSVIDAKNWVCSDGYDKYRYDEVMHESIFRFTFLTEENKCYKESF